MKLWFLLFSLSIYGNSFSYNKFYLNKIVQLNSNLNFDIVQDSKYKYYWIGTDNGIYYFNGLEYLKVRDIPDGKSVISLNVTDSFVYFYTKDGIMGSISLLNFKVKTYNLNQTYNYIISNSLNFAKNTSLPFIIAKNNTNYFKVTFYKDHYTLTKINFKSSINILRENILSTQNINDATYILTNLYVYVLKKKQLNKIINNDINFTSMIIDKHKNLIFTGLNGSLYIYNQIEINSILKTKKNINSFYFNSIDNKIYFSDQSYNLYSTTNQKIKTIYKNFDNKIIDYRIMEFDDKIFYNFQIFNKNDNHIKEKKIRIFDTIMLNSKVFYICTGYSDIKISDLKHENKIYIDDIKDNNGNYSKITDILKINDKLYFSTIFGLNFINFNLKTINKKTSIIKNNYIDKLKHINSKLFYLSNQKDIYYYDLKKNIIKPLFESSNFNINIIYDYNFIYDSIMTISTDKGLAIFKFNKLINEATHFNLINQYQGEKLEKIKQLSHIGNTLFFLSTHSIYSCNLTNISSIKNYLSFNISINNNFIDDNFNEEAFEITDSKRNLNVEVISPSFNQEYNFYKIKVNLIKNDDTIILKSSDNKKFICENLDKGEYEICINYNTLNNELIEIKKIKIEILPFYYETWYFRISILLLFLMIAYFASITIYNLKLKNKIIAIENENYELKMMRAQLRPHFIYNTLSTLKSTIYFHQYNKSLDLIDKISFFLRSNIKIESELTRDLQTEINEIINYIEIENFRTDNKISFINNISSSYIIPSNILQPIIENSILHGLKSDKKLIISLNLNEFAEHIEILITNNGKPIKLDSSKHESFAIRSITKRINHFNKNKIKNPFTLKNTTIENEDFVENCIKLIKNESINC